MQTAHPLRELEAWLQAARAAGVPKPSSVAFTTVGEGGQPSARTVSLKHVEEEALIFTTALWTRKAHELEENPHIALLFHWPAIGRQIHVTGEAHLAERALAEQLFSERDLPNQFQTVVSRQGETIEDLAPLRARHEHLLATMETPPVCPEDWGAVRVTPTTIEFLDEAEDRLHDRLLYTRGAGGDWTSGRLSP